MVAQAYHVLSPDEASRLLKEPSHLSTVLPAETESFACPPPATLQPISPYVRHYRVRDLPGLGTGHMADDFVSAAPPLGRSGDETSNFVPSTQSALADTGATVSLIDLPLAQRLLNTPVQVASVTLQGLGTAKTCGRATIAFTVDASRNSSKGSEALCLHFRHEFHLMTDLTPGIILGLDFLHGHGVSLEPLAGIARLDCNITFPLRCLKGPAVPLTPVEVEHAPVGPEARFTSSAARRRDWCLHVAHNVTIEPGHEQWVPCKWPEQPPPGDLVVEPSLWLDERRDLCFASKGCLANRELPALLVANPGDLPVTVPGDLPISTASCRETVAVNEMAATIWVADAGDTEVPAEAPDLPRLETHPTPVTVGDDARSAMIDDVFHVGKDATSGEVHRDIVDLLREYQDCFSLDGVPGKAVGPELRVELEPGARLAPEAPRRTGPEKRAIIDQQIDQLLEWDVIEPSTSCTSYPVLLVKQGAKWRFCVDFRGLNSITLTDRYPLPRTDDIFSALSESTLFSVLDAVKGFNQLPVHPDDRHKLAFICHRGLFQYKRMPFGIKNGPAWFQRFMDRLLGPLRWSSAMVYLDDVVVFSKNLAEHVDALRKLFTATRLAGLRYDPKKCHFAVDCIKLLGRCVSADGVAVLPDRVEAILAISPPSTQEDLGHFLGLMGYYAMFIARFAQEVAPLRKLQRGVRYAKKGRSGQAMMVLANGEQVPASKVPLDWQPEQQLAFDRLRSLLSDATTLALPV
ncbi:unnamed protein product [Parajaminaea phylloscopi]